MNTAVQVNEAYKEYQPPFNVARVVRVLLGYVPGQYLRGLQCVVLTNSEALSHHRRRSITWRRKRKVKVAQARAVYHGASPDNLPYIEIFVDNIVEYEPPLLLKLPFFRDAIVAEVLYHELGHHIHLSLHPEYKEREDIAEQWAKKLTGSFLRRRYWHLNIVVYPLGYSVRFLKWIARFLRKLVVR